MLTDYTPGTNPQQQQYYQQPTQYIYINPNQVPQQYGGHPAGAPNVSVQYVGYPNTPNAPNVQTFNLGAYLPPSVAQYLPNNLIPGANLQHNYHAQPNYQQQQFPHNYANPNSLPVNYSQQSTNFPHVNSAAVLPRTNNAVPVQNQVTNMPSRSNNPNLLMPMSAGGNTMNPVLPQKTSASSAFDNFALYPPTPLVQPTVNVPKSNNPAHVLAPTSSNSQSVLSPTNNDSGFLMPSNVSPKNSADVQVINQPQPNLLSPQNSSTSKNTPSVPPSQTPPVNSFVNSQDFGDFQAPQNSDFSFSSDFVGPSSQDFFTENKNAEPLKEEKQQPAQQTVALLQVEEQKIASQNKVKESPKVPERIVQENKPQTFPVVQAESKQESPKEEKNDLQSLMVKSFQLAFAEPKNEKPVASPKPEPVKLAKNAEKSTHWKSVDYRSILSSVPTEPDVLQSSKVEESVSSANLNEEDFEFGDFQTANNVTNTPNNDFGGFHSASPTPPLLQNSFSPSTLTPFAPSSILDPSPSSVLSMHTIVPPSNDNKFGFHNFQNPTQPTVSLQPELSNQQPSLQPQTLLSNDAGKLGSSGSFNILPQAPNPVSKTLDPSKQPEINFGEFQSSPTVGHASAPLSNEKKTDEEFIFGEFQNPQQTSSQAVAPLSNDTKQAPILSTENKSMFEQLSFSSNMTAPTPITTSLSLKPKTLSNEPKIDFGSFQSSPTETHKENEKSFGFQAESQSTVFASPSTFEFNFGNFQPPTTPTERFAEKKTPLAAVTPTVTNSTPAAPENKFDLSNFFSNSQSTNTSTNNSAIDFSFFNQPKTGQTNNSTGFSAQISLAPSTSKGDSSLKRSHDQDERDINREIDNIPEFPEVVQKIFRIIIGNIVRYPNEHKYRSINSQGKSFTPVFQNPEALPFLIRIGFQTSAGKIIYPSTLSVEPLQAVLKKLNPPPTSNPTPSTPKETASAPSNVVTIDNPKINFANETNSSQAKVEPIIDVKPSLLVSPSSVALSEAISAPKRVFSAPVIVEKKRPDLTKILNSLIDAERFEEAFQCKQIMTESKEASEELVSQWNSSSEILTLEKTKQYLASKLGKKISLPFFQKHADVDLVQLAKRDLAEAVLRKQQILEEAK